MKLGGLCALLAGLARGSALICNATAGAEPAFAQGETALLCVHLLPQEVKVVFALTVDAFVALSARRIYDAANGRATDLSFQLGNSALLSSPSAYIRPAAPAHVFPLFNVLVTLENGVVAKLQVEDIAAACAATAAADALVATDYAFAVAANTTRNCPVDACTDAQSASGRCDFKALIAWVGTDRNGVGLLSSVQRLANYKHYNMPGMLAGLLAVDNNANATAPEAYQPDLLGADAAGRLAPA